MIRYCGREFSLNELDQIRSLIKNNPKFNRTRISVEVCRMLEWLKPDGKVKDMSCRVAMLRMQKDGLVLLPPSTRTKRPVRNITFTSSTDQQCPIVDSVDLLPKLHLKIVTKTNSALWNEYIERYHYLGYTQLPGAQLRYFIYAGDQVVALTGVTLHDLRHDFLIPVAS